MPQEGKAGKTLHQVGRDYYRRTIQISILNGESIFSLPVQLFKYISKHVKFFFEKDKIIRELEDELKEKTDEIERLRPILNHYIEKLQEAQTQMQQAMDVASNVYKKASEIGIYDESIKTLYQYQLSRSLDNLNKQNKQAEPYMSAALWVLPRINEWAEEATEEIAGIHSTDISPTKKDLFYKEILKYLEWLQKSMLYAKPLRKTLGELNDSRNIPQPHPYRETFKYLKSKVTIKYMSPEEFHALHKMIDFLIDNL